MYFGCDLNDLSMEEYIKDFELLGYTHEESIELAKTVFKPVTIDPNIDWDKIVEKVIELPTVNVISAEDVRKALERCRTK